MICTRLRPGHLSIRVGDGSRCNEEIVKKSRIAPPNAIIIVIDGGGGGGGGNAVVVVAPGVKVIIAIPTTLTLGLLPLLLFLSPLLLLRQYRLVGLVVRRPPQERKILGSNPAGGGIFSGSSHISDLKIGTPVATLPGAWCYRVSAGTGRPGVSIL